MPNSFVTLWTLDRCRWLQSVSDSGPIEGVFGGPHTSLPALNSVIVGDTIYPVTVKKGNLHVLARLPIDELVDPDNYVETRLNLARPHRAARLGTYQEMWDISYHELRRSHPEIGHRFPTTCCDVAAVGRSGSEIRFDRVLPEQCLPRIMLGPRPGKELPLKGVEEGRLKNNFSLQGHVRRLSQESAVMFEGLFLGR